MFEKEAIIHAFEATIGLECLNKPIEDFTYEELSYELQEKAYDFKKGAEFGYNKANEWHKVADGTIPKENKRYLVQIKDNGLAIAYFNGQHWETRYNLGESGHCVETVIAWREIPTFEE